MSDDLTARIDKALDGRTPGRWTFDTHEAVYVEAAAMEDDIDVATLYSRADGPLIAAAPSLLAEARDEIARLREGITRHRDRHRDSPAIRVLDRELWALLDAPSTASPVRDGANTEQEQQ